ncbi:NAD(P)-binding protein [Dissoconium aciculare CBS 342.82]|uniref:NAD(P)-binding protein n=1 Tax=Dissoconium aciculare CBS 342.82 TaxID=1314786 RepID=A0A6J3LU16_9PEZI|nr:NAD(P)-binding protein [Dissoconium aciculare CBS 342.82]KAF1818112.1 NAD(P)-binding protein [Dissoconium aciculare CBS 342.82]
MGNFVSQSFFIPKPTLTEQTCPDQKDRVFIVTGGYAGVGQELSRILYSRNGTVYIAGRSAEKAEKAIASIKDAHPTSAGKIAFLKLDLADLATIKPAVESFTAQESRLDVLVNNAGVMFPPVGSLTAQSHDLQTGTNLLGPYTLYKSLAPLLAATAKSAPTASVRVAWAGSVGIEVLSPKPGGMILDANGAPVVGTKGVTNEVNYAQTKAGNYFFAKELARQEQAAGTGVVHVAFNPGNLRTELQRHFKGVGATLTDVLLLYPAVFGAYTELFSAVSPEITPEKSGSYIWPWGRVGGLRPDVEKSVKSEAEGGTGLSAKFLQWVEKETKAFVA